MMRVMGNYQAVSDLYKIIPARHGCPPVTRPLPTSVNCEASHAKAILALVSKSKSNARVDF